MYIIPREIVSDEVTLETILAMAELKGRTEGEDMPNGAHKFRTEQQFSRDDCELFGIRFLGEQR